MIKFPPNKEKISKLNLIDIIPPEVQDYACVAGSSVTAAITETAFSDVDIFLIAKTDKKAIEVIKTIIEQRTDGTFIRNSGTISFRLKSERGNVKVQIILRRYLSVSEVITGFDLDASCCAWFKNKVYTTRRGKRALDFGVNTVNIDLASNTYESRLRKYAGRGFDIQLPKTMNQSEIKKIQNYIDTRLTSNRGVINTHNLGYLLFLLQGSDRSDYDAFTLYDRGDFQYLYEKQSDGYSIIDKSHYDPTSEQSNNNYWLIMYDNNTDPTYLDPEDEEKYGLKLMSINPGQQNYSWSVHPVNVSWEKWSSLEVIKRCNIAEARLGLCEERSGKKVAVYNNLDMFVWAKKEQDANPKNCEEIVAKYGKGNPNINCEPFIVETENFELQCVYDYYKYSPSTRGQNPRVSTLLYMTEQEKEQLFSVVNGEVSQQLLQFYNNTKYILDVPPSSISLYLGVEGVPFVNIMASSYEDVTTLTLGLWMIKYLKNGAEKLRAILVKKGEISIFDFVTEHANFEIYLYELAKTGSEQYSFKSINNILEDKFVKLKGAKISPFRDNQLVLDAQTIKLIEYIILKPDFWTETGVVPKPSFMFEFEFFEIFTKQWGPLLIKAIATDEDSDWKKIGLISGLDLDITWGEISYLIDDYYYRRLPPVPTAETIRNTAQNYTISELDYFFVVNFHRLKPDDAIDIIRSMKSIKLR
jgi:hypothetical protein